MIQNVGTITDKTGETCILRSPQPADAAAMLACMQVTAAETEFVISYPDELDFTTQSEAEFLENMAKAPREAMLCIFAADNTTMLGSAALTCVNPRRKTRHRAELGIALRQAVWGRGLGARLITELLHFAQTVGYQQVELEVVEGNTRAAALYQKLGFVRYGTRPAAFRLQDGSTANEILMVKTL